VDIRPAYQDADPAGVVWHGNYFHYFDTARCALLDKLDYGYRAMEESGHLWPIVDTRVRFIKSATYDQNITVTAVLREWEYRVKIDYTVRDDEEQSIAEGHREACRNRRAKRSCHIAACTVSWILTLFPTNRLDSPSVDRS